MNDRVNKPAAIVLPPIPAKRYFTIGEVSELCGVKPHVFGRTNDDGTEVAEGEISHGHLFHTFLAALGIDASQSYQLNGQASPIGDPACSAIDELLV